MGVDQAIDKRKVVVEDERESLLWSPRLPMAWEGEGPSGHPAELERAVRDGPRLRGSVALPIHVLSFSIGNLGLHRRNLARDFAEAGQGPLVRSGGTAGR